MTMLIPLGVLAVGAVFSGMIWYGSFFGSHEEVNEFFGIPVHEAEAEAEQGAETADAHGEATDMATVDAETTAGEGTAMAEADHGVPAQDHQDAPEGAIFMAADNTVMDDAHHAPAWVKVSPFIAMLIGFFTAWLFYVRKPELPAQLATSQRPLYNFLLNKWYFDEIYDAIFVRPAKWLGNMLWRRGDGNVIDGTLNGVALGLVPFLTRLAGRAQSGYLFHYAFAMVLGMAILITWMTLGGGAN